MRKIIQIKNGIKLAKVYYENSVNEYSVKLWVNGIINKDATYFTDDKIDAIQTAQVMTS